MLANAWVARGISALVTDGGVRDTREIVELGFPVFAKHVCIQGTVKESLGPINQPIVLGDEVIHPGDVVKGDRDGVVIVRRSEVQSAIDACQEREAAESGYIERYKNGETPTEVSNLAAILQAKGLTVDR